MHDSEITFVFFDKYLLKPILWHSNLTIIETRKKKGSKIQKVKPPLQQSSGKQSQPRNVELTTLEWD